MGALLGARSRRGVGAFSLIELVLVIVILALIAAVAIPRFSRGTEGSADASTAKSASILQRAIDLYAAEHGDTYPDPNLISDQLTLYTDAMGATSKNKTPPYSFGPYVRKVPAVPLGPNKGSTGIATAAGAGVGWLYNPSEGTISAYTGSATASPTTLPAGPTQPLPDTLVVP
jgi:type II secretory pathway pseudopilin PulG